MVTFDVLGSSVGPFWSKFSPNRGQNSAKMSTRFRKALCSADALEALWHCSVERTGGVVQDGAKDAQNSAASRRVARDCARVGSQMARKAPLLAQNRPSKTHSKKYIRETLKKCNNNSKK